MPRATCRRPARAALACVLAGLAFAAPARAAAPASRPATAPAAPALAAPPADTPLRPFTAFSWHPPGLWPRVRPMLRVGLTTPPWEAAQLTKRMDDGGRVVLMVDVVNGLHEHPDDVCRTPAGWPTAEPGVWPAAGTRFVAARADALFASLAAAGGRVDMLVLDLEEGYSCWSPRLTDARLAAVRADPRFPALAGRLGFADLGLVNPWRSARTGEYLRWNAVMDRTITAAYDAGIFAPLRRHFPAAGMCNFNGASIAEADVLPDKNGHRPYTLGDPTGTRQAPAVYGVWSPPGIPADVRRPFTQVVYAANLARAGAVSSRWPVLPWVGFKSWTADGTQPIPWGRTAYWEEGVFHTLLGGGADNALFFNPADPRVRAPDDPASVGARPADNAAMDAAMADLERAAGGRRVAAARPAATMTPWDATTVATSARLADGSVLTRVTFADGATTADVDAGDGRRVTIARPPGKVGAWVRVPGEQSGRAEERKRGSRQ